MERRQLGSVAALRLAARRLSAPTWLTQRHTPAEDCVCREQRCPRCAPAVTVLSCSHSALILSLGRVYSVRASLTPTLKQPIIWPLPNFGSTGYFTSENNCEHALKMISGLAVTRVAPRPDPRRVA